MTFVGGPPSRYSTVARMVFDLLVGQGLRPHHRLVDIGAGALRCGTHLIGWLNAGNYYALEPNRDMFARGVCTVGEPGKVDHNDRFDVGVFGRVDFGVARSVWTHAAFWQIEALMRSWAMWADGPLLASYLPGAAYRGDTWVGRSHRSDRPGTVTHDLDAIRAAAADFGLSVSDIDGHVVARQRWLRVES